MHLDALPSAVSSTSICSLLPSTTLPDSSGKRLKSRLWSTKPTHTFALARRMWQLSKDILEAHHRTLPISRVVSEHSYKMKLLLRTNETFWMCHYHQFTACHGLHQHDQGHCSSPQLSRDENTHSEPSSGPNTLRRQIYIVITTNK